MCSRSREDTCELRLLRPLSRCGSCDADSSLLLYLRNSSSASSSSCRHRHKSRERQQLTRKDCPPALIDWQVLHGRYVSHGHHLRLPISAQKGGHLIAAFSLAWVAVCVSACILLLDEPIPSVGVSWAPRLLWMPLLHFKELLIFRLMLCHSLELAGSLTAQGPRVPLSMSQGGQL
jgi:hypothetical protein